MYCTRVSRLRGCNQKYLPSLILHLEIFSISSIMYKNLEDVITKQPVQYKRLEDPHKLVSVNVSVNGILGHISSLSRRASLDTPLRTTTLKSTPNFMDPAVI